MYIFGTVISAVIITLSLIFSVALSNTNSAQAAMGDPVAQGFKAYDQAYSGFMKQYGSVNNNRYPTSNQDLFPRYGFAPASFLGATWQFGQISVAGNVTPYACVTVSVTGLALLEAIKQRAYQSGAMVLSGSSCTGTLKSMGNLGSSSFPLTISAVKYYTGKLTKITQG